MRAARFGLGWVLCGCKFLAKKSPGTFAEAARLGFSRKETILDLFFVFDESHNGR